MKEDKLKEVFKFLQDNYNKDNLFYFKLTSMKNIKAYFNESNREFATFYIDKIIEYLNEEEDYEDLD